MVFIPSVVRPFVLLVAESSVCNPCLDCFQTAHLQTWKWFHRICLCKYIPPRCIIVSHSLSCSQSNSLLFKASISVFDLLDQSTHCQLGFVSTLEERFLASETRHLQTVGGCTRVLVVSVRSELMASHEGLRLIKRCVLFASFSFHYSRPELYLFSLHRTSGNRCHKMSACFFRLTNMSLVSMITL
ncbi:hypothetical protein GOODEAATRI_000804 [Goodea atripinnis]|uniref:Secreted protein n=1 Tax=Goodea atripinnis TaxID=208336 RepID=A0ABV0PJS0_9TELE